MSEPAYDNRAGISCKHQCKRDIGHLRSSWPCHDSYVSRSSVRVFFSTSIMYTLKPICSLQLSFPRPESEPSLHPKMEPEPRVRAGQTLCNDFEATKANAVHSLSDPTHPQRIARSQVMDSITRFTSLADQGVGVAGALSDR